LRERKNNTPKRRGIVLWVCVGLLLRIFAFFRGQRFENRIKINGPAITLSNHSSWFDFAFTFSALYPKRTMFIAAEKMFYEPTLSPWLRFACAIPKKLYSADPRCVASALKLLKAGEIVSIFPEGQVSTTGKSIPVLPATAKLLKKAAVPVYAIVHQNAGLVNPEWSKRTFSGTIITRYKLILTPQDLETLSHDEIHDIITRELYFDPFEYNKIHKYEYKVKPVDRLDYILFRCVKCGFAPLETVKNTIICPQCGDKRALDKYGTLAGRSIDAHYRDLEAFIKRECGENPDYAISARVRLMTFDRSEARKMMFVAGEGTLTLSRSGYVYEGTRNGETITRRFDPAHEPYLPGDIGRNVQIYSGSEYFQFEFDEPHLPARYAMRI